MLALLPATLAAQTDSLRSVAIGCLGGAGYRVVDLTRVQSGAFLATATLDSFAIRVLVDPEAPYTFLDGAAVRKLGYTPEPTTRVVSFGGASEPLYQLNASTFALGTMNAGAVTFDVTRIADVLDAAGLADSSVAGVIGRAFLKRCEALLDIDTDRLFVLQPRPEVPDSAAVAAAARDSAASDDIISNIEKRIRAREEKRHKKQEQP